jgi:SAM-dependent methyltransferase
MPVGAPEGRVSEGGLDYAFLQHMGHDSAQQKVHQRMYLAFFEGCSRVIDLGCGNGEFVEMLGERGIDAVGVDADPEMVRHMRERGTPVVERDVMAYMADLPALSIDGVFAAHLVEHLPYRAVLQLARDAYRALRPGGVIVLVAPDPRSLYAHLEMFYRHFGHVGFYDPRLLCFFLEQGGFVATEYGSNASPVHPASPLLGLPEIEPVEVSLPVWEKGPLHRLLRGLRMAIAYLFLNPYLDRIDANFRHLKQLMSAVDRPFECYARARKPGTEDGMPGTA